MKEWDCCYGTGLGICALPNNCFCLQQNLSNLEMNISIGGYNAFFMETSRIAVSLDYRQACSVESLLFRNPNLHVYLFMTGPLVNYGSSTLKTLQNSYPNLKIVHLNLTEYIAGTLLERWFHCSGWENGKYSVAHLSDALRLLSLTKYGGFYSDLDIIHLHPLIPLRNFLVAEDRSSFGNSAMHADYNHPVINAFLKEFAFTYRYLYAKTNINTNKWVYQTKYIKIHEFNILTATNRKDEWSFNGPMLITRIMKKRCNVDDISHMTPERCNRFNFLPTSTFYPIHYSHHMDYFKEGDVFEDSMPNWNDSVIGAHVWNKLSANLMVNKDSNLQLYARLARPSCPKIFEIAPPHF